MLVVVAVAACTPEQTIRVIFGDHADEAVDVADCESRLDPGAVSLTNDHGLFQINARWHRETFERVTGQPWSQVYDPMWNALYAKWLHDQQGWAPWSCAP